METTIAACLFFGFLVGGILLALTMGVLSTEQKRAQEARESSARVAPSIETAVVIPAFFAQPNGRQAVWANSDFNDELLASIQLHVRTEHDAVAQFLHHPSVQSLYCQAPQSSSVN